MNDLIHGGHLSGGFIFRTDLAELLLQCDSSLDLVRINAYNIIGSGLTVRSSGK